MLCGKFEERKGIRNGRGIREKRKVTHGINFKRFKVKRRNAQKRKKRSIWETKEYTFRVKAEGKIF